jgi:hypothetical protein
MDHWNLGAHHFEVRRADDFESYSEREILRTRQRWRRRKQTKLANHSNIVPIRKVLNDLAIEHPIHVHMLNLESATRGLHPHEHSAIHGKVRGTFVCAAVSASKNHPLALGYRVQRRQPRVGEVGLNLSQHSPHASTPYISAMILAILGEAAYCCVEVAAIECFMELFGDAPIGFGNVQGSLRVHPVQAKILQTRGLQ